MTRCASSLLAKAAASSCCLRLPPRTHSDGWIASGSGDHGRENRRAFRADAVLRSRVGREER